MPSRARGWLIAALTSAVVVSVLVGWVLYQRQRIVVLDINGVRVRYHTREPSTQDILDALGIVPEAGDVYALTPRQDLTQGAPLPIHVARPIYLLVDDGLSVIAVGNVTLGQALHQAGYEVGPDDLLTIAGQVAETTMSLPLPELRARATAHEIIAALRQPIQVVLERGNTMTVQDGDATYRFVTHASQVGQALAEQGLAIYVGDLVEPALNATLNGPTAVTIVRSAPVALEVGGEPLLVRTRAETVNELLAQERIALGELDLVRPSLDAPVVPQGLVQVVRVLVERYVEEIPVAFEERWEPDPSIEIDQRQIKHWGREGAERRLWQVRYENDGEVERIEQQYWIAREPIDRVIRYGTKIVVRELQTPSGTITYWRKLRMLATSYNAPTAGKSADHPTYGITRTGVRARKGIIAVDPRVVSLGQQLYVPGYGQGIAGDTGGAIKWRRIDLCFDDNNLELWYRWVDVYQLTPVPDKTEINWVITNWPKERG